MPEDHSSMGFSHDSSVATNGDSNQPRLQVLGSTSTNAVSNNSTNVDMTYRCGNPAGHNASTPHSNEYAIDHVSQANTQCTGGPCSENSRNHQGRNLSLSRHATSGDTQDHVPIHTSVQMETDQISIQEAYDAGKSLSTQTRDMLPSFSNQGFEPDTSQSSLPYSSIAVSSTTPQASVYGRFQQSGYALFPTQGNTPYANIHGRFQQNLVPQASVQGRFVQPGFTTQVPSSYDMGDSLTPGPRNTGQTPQSAITDERVDYTALMQNPLPGADVYGRFRQSSEASSVMPYMYPIQDQLELS